MNNEIQLSNLGQSLPMQAGPQPGFAPAGGSSSEENPLQKVHKLLRGRYLLACVLGFLGATAGAVAGFLSQKPAYVANLLIEIKPVILQPDGTKDKLMVMFSAFVNSQMTSLQSDNLAKVAMADPRFKEARAGLPPLTVPAFGENLTVALAPRSNTIISVAYSCKGPQAEKESVAAVQGLLAAWQADYENDETAKAVQKRADYWMKQRDKYDSEIKAKGKEIEREAKESGGEPQMIAKYDEDVKRIEDERAETKKTRDAVIQIVQAIKSKIRPDFAPEDWARLDKTMADLIVSRDKLDLDIRAALNQGVGANHPSIQKSQALLATIKSQIVELSNTLGSRYVILTKPDGVGGALASKSVDEFDQRIKTCDEQLKELKERVAKIRAASTAIARLNTDIASLNLDVQKARQNLADCQFQLENQTLYVVKNDGKTARPDKDRRALFAAAGFMGGAGIPIGLLMLFGLFDTRYRYSDEAGAGSSGIGGLTLLGILPNLPDRLSDPEQAAIAAHCVHQIRTMLQINANLEDRHVFAVTSASPGDGKTSLTLALGLSYAACGTRTLLIDCDLIGSGLSSRMNVSASEGVLEAIANQSLMSYVRQTDVNDVSILPVGSSGNLHASTLSPQSLRRLIAEAEQHFEVVLIDTGPILGSIEASLVCAAADAVILTVSRGQQRPMVERSLGHLGAIGARLAGVVFNRAQSQDFERSISGVAMRSVGVPGLPRGARPTGPRLGPVARAVQSDEGVSGDDYNQPAGE